MSMPCAYGPAAGVGTVQSLDAAPARAHVDPVDPCADHPNAVELDAARVATSIPFSPPIDGDVR